MSYDNPKEYGVYLNKGEQIAPWILDCNFRQAIIRSSQGISLFFSENGMTRWIFRVWGPKRWLLCNPEYDYDRV